MEKSEKETTVKTVKTKKIANIQKKSLKKVMPVAILVLILIGGFVAYFKLGNVAVVNGKQISRLQYIKNMEKQVGKQTLEQMINESLILGEASNKGVKVDKSEIDTEISKIEEQIKAQGMTLEGALTTEGMTRTELESQIRLQKLVEKMAVPTTEITDAQIQEFLTKNKDQLPKDASKEELQKLAKDQLTSQASNDAISGWLEGLKNNAKIIYR